VSEGPQTQDLHRRRYSGLDELEDENRRETLKHHARDVALIQRVLNDFLPAFDALHGYRMQHDWERLLLILTVKAFNSLRCAYDALLRAYYSQALTLVRTVYEDNLTCLYVHNHRDEASLWLKGAKVPSFATMRSRLHDLPEEKLRESYGILSTFAHPREGALLVTIERLGSTVHLRLGGRFDSDHFIAAAYMLLAYGTGMLAIPAIFLATSRPDWLKRITDTRDEVIAWLRRVNEEMGRDSP
jgi:hypothetical protein